MPEKVEFRPRPDASTPHPPILTPEELRELIEERAWLRARRAGRGQWTPEDWAAAHEEVRRRLGAES